MKFQVENEGGRLNLSVNEELLCTSDDVEFIGEKIKNLLKVAFEKEDKQER